MKLTYSIVFLLLANFSFTQNYTLKNLKLNDKLSHYGVVPFQNNEVYFTSYMVDGRGKPRRDKAKRLIYTVYKGETTKAGEIVNAEQFNKTQDFVFNTSSAAFSPDGKYMYITANFIKKGKSYKQNYKSVNLHIRRGEYIAGKGWTNFEPLSFCDPNFNYGHPALSPDGTTLYFTSNIPSAKGPTDLFKVKLIGSNEFGEIENLGMKVNSVRKEMFPYVSANNVLYFASDRVGGVGGLDIYKYDLNTTDKNAIATPLPKPINSRLDDFCFTINKDNTYGYFASRRPKGKGDDDIYYFEISNK